MYAIPFTASRWRLAQSKPRAEPQSWTTTVTCSYTSRSWSRASRYLRCSTKRYEPGPLLGNLSESPMPIRSGAMQRPRGCRYGNTLRQRYDEVGLPCSSTIGSPFPTSTYAISLPRTCRRCFWYGNAAETMFALLLNSSRTSSEPTSQVLDAQKHCPHDITTAVLPLILLSFPPLSTAARPGPRHRSDVL